jgi:hypothetical protein
MKAEEEKTRVQMQSEKTFFLFFNKLLGSAKVLLEKGTFSFKIV